MLDEEAEGDGGFGAGEGGAEAVVEAVAEDEVAVGAAGEVEAVRVGEVRGVPGGGGQGDLDGVAGGYRGVREDQLTGTMAIGERVRTAPDAWTGLNDYLKAVFDTLAADRGTNDLMTTHVHGVDVLADVHEHNRRTVDHLLRRGRDEGTIRADITTEDVLFALAALGRAVPALATATAPDAWRRPLALLLDSLRPPATTATPPPPLPEPALTAEQLGNVLAELGPHRAAPRA